MFKGTGNCMMLGLGMEWGIWKRAQCGCQEARGLFLPHTFIADLVERTRGG